MWDFLKVLCLTFIDSESNKRPCIVFQSPLFGVSTVEGLQNLYLAFGTETKTNQYSWSSKVYFNYGLVNAGLYS